MNRTVVARDVEGESGNSIFSSSEHILKDTLQMFTDDDEIYNERLLTDTGFEKGAAVKRTDVEEAEGEFGVWLRVTGAEDQVGVWPQNKKQGEPREFYKIISNQDEIFMKRGQPKEIRIHEFLQKIIQILKTSGTQKRILIKNNRAKNRSGHNRKWPRMNTDIDNVEIFFANCSPSENNLVSFTILQTTFV